MLPCTPAPGHSAAVPSRELAPLASGPATHRLVLDGGLVTLTAGGRPSRHALQVRIGPRSLVPAGPQHDARPSSLATWSSTSTQLVDAASHLGGAAAPRGEPDHGYEEVVAKMRSSPYRPRARSGEWLKVKVPRHELMVIAGWRPSDVHPDRVGSRLTPRPCRNSRSPPPPTTAGPSHRRPSHRSAAARPAVRMCGDLEDLRAKRIVSDIIHVAEA